MCYFETAAMRARDRCPNSPTSCIRQLSGSAWEGSTFAAVVWSQENIEIRVCSVFTSKRSASAVIANVQGSLSSSFFFCCAEIQEMYWTGIFVFEHSKLYHPVQPICNRSVALQFYDPLLDVRVYIESKTHLGWKKPFISPSPSVNKKQFFTSHLISDAEWNFPDNLLK